MREGSPPLTCQVLHVMCHLSCVMCPMSHFIYFFCLLSTGLPCLVLPLHLHILKLHEVHLLDHLIFMPLIVRLVQSLHTVSFTESGLIMADDFTDSLAFSQTNVKVQLSRSVLSFQLSANGNCPTIRIPEPRNLLAGRVGRCWEVLFPKILKSVLLLSNCQ